MLEQLIYSQRFSENSQQRAKIWRLLVVHFFQRFIEKDDVVLDVACGYGEFINNITCKKKYGVDINSDSKKYLNKNVTFLRCSSINIKLPNESIDKIFVSNFFEHLTREEIIKTIIEFRRILRKDGNILILQPNIRFCGNDYWMFFDHITPIDDRALVEIFGVENFTLKKEIVKFLPFTTKSRLPKNNLIIKIYLLFPFLWHIFGKQSFLIFKKND